MSKPDIAFRLTNVGKEYRIGELQEHATLRESVMNVMARPIRRFRTSSNGQDGASAKESFWALHDINLEVNRGEVVGIIGRNGAGKSTILKLLSRITEPTCGRIELYGRVGSLLEVGTGFHPELTGRENVYLNGAILGMSKAEITEKFDEIVAFSEVEKFLDMPVKRFSSGMYVRLAFAVAAHLEPEILLVDEVLAVGDAAFQKKCLGKLDSVADAGRAVVFVSHNMGLIQSLCSRSILVRDGEIVEDGPTADVVAAYLRMLEREGSTDLREREDRGGRGDVRITQIEISAGTNGAVLSTGCQAQFSFHLTEMRTGVACCFTIYDQFGQPVAHLNSAYRSPEDVLDPDTDKTFVCRLPELPLAPGRYRIDAELWQNGELQDQVGGAAYFDVEYGSLSGRPYHDQSGFGSALFHHRWTVPYVR